MGPYGWDGGGMVAMALLMVIFWLAVIAAVVAFVRSSRHASPDRRSLDATGDGQALRILEERFAAGLVDTEDYRQRRAVLTAR